MWLCVWQGQGAERLKDRRLLKHLLGHVYTSHKHCFSNLVSGHVKIIWAHTVNTSPDRPFSVSPLVWGTYGFFCPPQ